MMKTALLSLVLSSALLGSLTAMAQPVRDPAAADELFEHGKALLQAGDWAGACAKFRVSMDLDPAVGTLLKIARCDEHDQKLALALHDYRAALELNRTKVDQTDARRAELEAFTRAALGQLEPRVPQLRIVVADPPPGLRLTRGDEELPLAALGEDLPVDPGSVEIVASAPGYRTERRAVAIEEGARMEVAIVLASEEPFVRTPTIGAVDHASSAPARNWGGTRRIGAYTLAGAGIVALGVAGYFAIETVSKVNQASSDCVNLSACPQPEYGAASELIRQAKDTQTAGLVLLAVGGSLVGAGAILFLTAPKHDQAASVVVGPSGAWLRGTF
jgi:hypothetical protein